VTAAIASSSDSNTRAGPRLVAALVPGELDHAALGREVAAQDRQAAGRLDRIASGRITSWPGVSTVPRGDLADRLAGHGRRVLVQQAGLLEALSSSATPPAGRGRGDEAPARLEVAQQRRALADRVEVVDLELDPHLAGECQQVQDAVGRAAAGGDRRDRVLDARG
jgi:hypothetical protein